MKTPLYETSVPVFVRMLGQLARILDKAFCPSQGIGVKHRSNVALASVLRIKSNQLLVNVLYPRE